MQLKIERSQRQSGVVSKTVMFCVDARIFLSTEEQTNVSHYKLGNQIIYSSEAAKRHAEASQARSAVAGAVGRHAIDRQDGRTGGLLAASAGHMAMGMFHAFASRLALKITIDSLQRGQHIECKDLDEVIDAENALKQACENLKGYLETAATFDGGAIVIDYSKDEPEIVSQPVLLAAPFAPAPIVQSTPTDFVAPSMPQMAEASTSSSMYPMRPPAPDANPFQPVFDWWASRTKEERRWIMILGGVVVLFVLYKIL